MGKKTVTEGLAIGKLLRRHSLYIMFFGYVAGYRDANPEITWRELADGFMRRFNLTDAEVDSDSLIREAQKMTNDYLRFGL